jgi:hypothetical protein
VAMEEPKKIGLKQNECFKSKANRPVRGTRRKACSIQGKRYRPPFPATDPRSTLRTDAVRCCLDCTDKDRLLGEYDRHAQEWSQAVQRLSDQVGSGHGEYLRLLDRVNETRATTQRARDAYARHIADHGC